MKQSRVLRFVLLAIFPFMLANAQVTLDIESGIVFPGYNDVRIPGKGGTGLSFTKELKSGNKAFVRGRTSYTFGDRHTLTALVAPLTINAKGSVPRPVVFQDRIFVAGVPLDAVWKFNSYRLTYRYDFSRTDDITFGLGLTAKVRDARISIAGGGQEATKSDLGFVPLINFRLLWNASPAWGILLEGDALAAPQGRAEDVLAAIVIRPGQDYTIRVGYRILEGGADNDEVYNFSLFNYAVLGLSVEL